MTNKQTIRALKITLKQNRATMKQGSYNLNDISTKEYPLTLIVNDNLDTSIKQAYKNINDKKILKKAINESIKEDYRSLIPKIKLSIKAKKSIEYYRNMSKKSLLDQVIKAFDSKDILTKNIFFLEERNISLPFGVLNNHVASIVKFLKKDYVTNNQCKHKSLEEILELIVDTNKIISDAKKEKEYQDRRLEELRSDTIVDVQLISA